MKALILNCTLKKSPEKSNTQALIDKVIAEYQKVGVESESLRIVDYRIFPGTSTDMGNGDQWPEIFEKIRNAEILIIASPIWVGHVASTAQQVVERLDAIFHEEALQHPETGQYITYNKIGGCIVTGNEDGAHSVCAQLLWAMQELGFTIPPNSNTYWVGEAGPGPNYLDAGGPRYLYTNKTYKFLAHNTAFFAKLLKENPITTNLNDLTDDAKSESDPENES